MTRPSDISPELWERADLLRDQFRHIDDDLEYTARVILAVESERKADHFGLTPRQLAVFNWITEYVAKRGYSPSYRNIADGCGLASRGNAHQIVKQLKERGALAALPGRVRTIVAAKVEDVSTARKNSVEA